RPGPGERVPVHGTVHRLASSQRRVLPAGGARRHRRRHDHVDDLDLDFHVDQHEPEHVDDVVDVDVHVQLDQLVHLEQLVDVQLDEHFHQLVHVQQQLDVEHLVDLQLHELVDLDLHQLLDLVHLVDVDVHLDDVVVDVHKLVDV